MNKWERIQYQPCIPLGEDAKRVTGCQKHIDISRQAAAEGMVLLKNDRHVLPLPIGAKVALFGIASADYVKGGGGSGDVYTEYCRNLCEGMKVKESEGKIKLFPDAVDFYENEAKRQYDKSVRIGKTTEPEVPVELLERAKAFADYAVISICRFSEEGWDRTDSDFYLTDEENKMVEAVCGAFDNTVIVLNVGGVVDTSEIKNGTKIKAALLAWQAGMEGALAEADILCGDCCPSGKLSDTFASAFEDYPSSSNFNESEDYVEYIEDIYVGYRYFETMENAASKVAYPFGFGLSYTDFNIDVLSAVKNGDIIDLEILVKNVGSFAGKEVVQVYFEAPVGLLGKPKRQLIGFKKTGQILPGQDEKVVISVDVRQMESFDDLGKIQKSAYLLEKGEYFLYVGNSVRNVDKAFAFTLDETIITKQLTSLAAPRKLSKRLLCDGSYESLPTGEYNEDKTDRSDWPQKPRWKYDPIQFEYERESKGGFFEVAQGNMTLDEFMDKLSDDDLIELVGGRPNKGVANTRGFGDLQRYNIPPALTADGPAGLRLNDGIYVATTAWPCATLLACTWNPELVRKIGACGAKEVKENNLAVWLTPGMNIHRSPLCGRNFEYYSEDPFLTGKIAAAMIDGIQSEHIAATAKHFCCNNKETNRHFSDSRVSERALREIYLKGFEIAVSEAKPWALMTSYNKVNGYYPSENSELLKGILRGEWHYDGLITTDWDNDAEHDREIIAGNNVRMPCGSGKRLQIALQQGLITREDLLYNARKVLELILKLD